MNTKSKNSRYDEEFKKSLVALHENGKTQTQIYKEHGVSQSALTKWIKQYSEIKTENGGVPTAKQLKELQKRNAQLESGNTQANLAILHRLWENDRCLQDYTCS
ncbi:MAG: transposase [Eubacteriales bacterium]|jgi:transposase